MDKNIILIGLVVGLDYKNPYLNIYEEFQRWKTHKAIRKYLEHGKCIEYGARTLNEGGYYAIPKVSFNGGMIVGCAAGFLNVAKVKGTHNAMKSGIIAAEAIFEDFINNGENFEYGKKLIDYEEKLKKSIIYSELYETRNFKGGFELGGLFFGLFHGLFTSLIKGKEFWKLISKHIDSKSTEKKDKHKKIDYPKHDGILTFDLLENLSRSGTNHDHDQPAHLRIKDNRESSMISHKEYGAPEERFCPARVYEFVTDEKNEVKLQINAQNCLHCKCCSIKMVNEYIDWTVPEGGGGPKYNLM
jgi:electron-transferring-flavoprotein dehydrogenase